MDAFNLDDVVQPVNQATKGEWYLVWLFIRKGSCVDNLCFPSSDVISNGNDESCSVSEFLRLFSKPKEDNVFLFRKKRQTQRKIAAFATKNFIYACEAKNEEIARIGALTFCTVHTLFLASQE